MIYQPKGKAREYSPLAVNIYKGCGHKCVYCYVPAATFTTRKEFDEEVKAKYNFANLLEKSAKNYAGTDKQVLMSFSTDPYNPLNDKLNYTRDALKILLRNKIPVAILTKSGKKVLRDLDVIKQFGKRIKVGASLTLIDEKESLKWERSAALPKERFESLRILHENGVKTWASLEPVLDPEQTIEIIKLTHSYVDEFQVGKLNHLKNQIDWKYFLSDAVTILLGRGKEFYIKEDLAEFDRDYLSKLDPKYTEMDYLTLPAFEKEDLFN